MTSAPRHSEAAFEAVLEHVDDEDFEWVEVDGERRPRPGMFVAQVVGRSMEPGIEDGAYLLPLRGSPGRDAPCWSSCETPATRRPAIATR